MAIPDFEQRRTILGLGHTVVKTRLNSYLDKGVCMDVPRRREKMGSGISILLALEEEENQEMGLMTEPLR